MASVVDRVTTDLASPRVLATLAGIGAVALAAGWLAHRLRARRLVVLGAALVPVLVATAVLVAPYFRQRQLVEALPEPAGSGVPAPARSGASPATARRVTAGPLRGLGGHGARGTVALHRLADGSRVVRFEDVDIEGTPTPRVYFVAGAGRQRPGGHAAGALKAERGTFHYPVPAGVTGTFTVLVWCERFAVPIAGATLRT